MPSPEPKPEPASHPQPEPTANPWLEPTSAQSLGRETSPTTEPDTSVRVGGLIPTPIEAEEADIVAPVLPPDAAEIQPQGADPLRSFAPPVNSDAYGSAEPQEPTADATQEYVPDPVDPVRQLGAAALSTASLEAAGAPTPRGGVPIARGDAENVPSFGEEEPFVPRFEPLGGVVPAPTPSVSFTTPKPPVRPASPLSDLAIPEADGPAYAPREEFLETQAPSVGRTPSAAEGSSPEPPLPPARPWASVDPTEVEFVEGEPLSVEVGTFGAEAPPVEKPDDREAFNPFAPTAPSWEGIIAGESSSPEHPVPDDDHATVGPMKFPPVVDPSTEGTATPEAPSQEDSAPGPGATPAEAHTGGATDTPASAAAEQTGALAPRAFSPDAAASSSEADASPNAPTAPAFGPPSAPHEPPTAPSPVTPGPAATPITPVASFFAATASRNANRADDTGGTPSVVAPVATPPQPGATPPFPGEAPHDDSGLEPAQPQAPRADAPRTTSIPKEPMRPEPVRTTATAYTPSTGAWARPAFAPADAVTQVNGMAPAGEAADARPTETAPGRDTATEPAATSESPETGPKPAKTHRRRRLVLWIILGLVVAGAATFLAYRLFFTPEPIILPTPTATAQAAAPTAQPVAITDASTFVTSMPKVVGTDVLIDYTITDTLGDTKLPARTAELVTLDYGPGSSTRLFTVEASQHYNQADAQATFEAYAKGVANVEDVVVNGETVGKRAFSTAGPRGTVVWRNGTAVFDLTGPAPDVLKFYEHFGL